MSLDYVLSDKQPLDEKEAATLKECYSSVDEWPESNFFYHPGSETGDKIRHAFGYCVEMEKDTAATVSKIMLNTVTGYTANGFRSKEAMIAHAKSKADAAVDYDEKQDFLRSLFFLTEFLNGKSMRAAVKTVMLSQFDEVVKEVNFYLVK